jgi:hypothetical protein
LKIYVIIHNYVKGGRWEAVGCGELTVLCSAILKV